MRHQWLYWLVCSCLFSCNPKTQELNSGDTTWFGFDTEVRTIVLHHFPDNQDHPVTFYYKVVPVSELPYFYHDRAIDPRGMDPVDLGYYTVMYKNLNEDRLHYMQFGPDTQESSIELPMLFHYGHKSENLITNKYHLMVRDVLHEENLITFDLLTGQNIWDDNLLRSRYTFASYSGWNASASIIQRAGLKVGDPFVILFAMSIDDLIYPLNLQFLKQHTDDYTIVVRP
ncbi:hypothetical protein PVA45_07935 (plasmid) [Entomospira entomophila]|uniref:Uncharacterized protein n=1 Tax=Entomospira entomophila TaxID=2719988 RepID=A0A968GFD5_9SPIO|nr:hypothetical protein [Entomospira entomophilus]NIZ41434.1 hypothetical protein [Entomospira entomophilus]WDI36384.1 hypothetical protein PVA45_07935 [Entomospira entomophilus]